MKNVIARNENGPLTFTVEAQVEGGQLVVPGTDTSLVNVAGADAANVLGVALYTALPEGTSNQTTTSYGATAIDFSLPQPEVAVAFKGIFKLVCAAAVGFGDPVKAAADGQVTLWDVAVDTDPKLILGQVVQPGGVSAGAEGLVRLSL